MRSDPRRPGVPPPLTGPAGAAPGLLRPPPLHDLFDALLRAQRTGPAADLCVRFRPDGAAWAPLILQAAMLPTGHAAMAAARAHAALAAGLAQDLGAWLPAAAAAAMQLELRLAWNPGRDPAWQVGFTIDRDGFGHGDPRGIPSSGMGPLGRFLRDAAARLPPPEGTPRTRVAVEAGVPDGRPVVLDWLVPHDDPVRATTAALLMLRVKLVVRVDRRFAAWEPAPVPLVPRADSAAGNAAAALAALDAAHPDLVAAIEDIGDVDDGSGVLPAG